MHACVRTYVHMHINIHTHTHSRTRQVPEGGLVQCVGQPLAVVLADTVETARAAARLVAVAYDTVEVSVSGNDGDDRSSAAVT